MCMYVAWKGEWGVCRVLTSLGSSEVKGEGMRREKKWRARLSQESIERL